MGSKLQLQAPDGETNLAHSQAALAASVATLPSDIPADARLGHRMAS